MKDDIISARMNDSKYQEYHIMEEDVVNATEYIIDILDTPYLKEA